MTPERAEELGRELFPSVPGAVALLLATQDDGATEEARRRAVLALQMLDPDNPMPAPEALFRFLEAQKPGAHHLRAVPRPSADDWEGGAGKAEDLAAPATTDSRPGFIPASRVVKAPPPDFVIEDLAVREGVTVLAGESGAGKSFVALDVAATVPRGAEWFGRATVQGSVAYIGFESDAVALRLQALEQKHGSLDGLYYLRASDPISPVVARGGPEEPSFGEQFVTGRLQRLAAELAEASRPRVVLVVIDTVRASMAGSEDNSENVAAYLRAVRRILAAVPGAAALLVHHAGWQDGEAKRERERGSSAFRGNADATLYLKVESGEGSEVFLTLTTLKVRDAERPAPIRLVRRRVDVLGFDRRGNPLSSCIVVEDTRTRHDRVAGAAVAIEAEDQAVALKVLRAMRDYPEATSRRKLRGYVGLGMPVVDGAIARLLRAGWATEGERGRPFTVTPDGLSALAGTQ